MITFDLTPPSGTIHFGIGQPSADLLPVELLRTASKEFFATARPEDLNYGVPRGDERFLNSLAAFLSVGYGEAVSADSLFLTAGNSQALDWVCSIFAKPGDTIFVEEPSYFLAFQMFADHGLKVVGIPVDESGLDVDLLEAQLEETTPAFLYSIPSFHNPGGQTLSAARRQRVVELSQEHGFLVVADEVYQLLSFGENPPPAALGTMAGSGSVLSLGSFSKILSPGLRLGWIQASPERIQQLLSTGLVNSGGSLNHFTSHVVGRAIDLGLQQSYLERLREAYRSRARAMDSALREHLSEVASWQLPEGGYFFWLKFDEGVDTGRLRQLASEQAPELAVDFQPGELFSSRSELKNYMRLCFAHYGEFDIREGVLRLKRLLDRFI